MITIQTQSDGVLFNFQDSTRYLYGDGSILTPYNSLTLIADESNVLTFRKSASNDIFITAGYDELGYSSKEEAINDLKTKLFKATGGSESGITSGDVETMIDNSLVDYYTDDEVDAALSGKADASDVTALENEVAAKADTSAVTAVNNALTAHTTDTGIHVNQQEKDGWNAKLDASAYTPTDLSEYWTSAQTEVAISAATSGKADTSAVIAVENEITVLGNALAGKANTAALTAHTSDTGIHVSAQEKNAWNGKADTSAVTAVANDVSTLSGAVDDAKAYYIDFAALTTQGIHDADWDAMVAAINAHRPIYAGLGDLYYTSECLYQDGGNRIIMTASDHNSHYFYTFVKNGSEDYSFTSETRPYVTDADKTAWNAKQDALSAGTGIEISGNVISATGGGGATYSAGTNISIDTANTINCTLPLTNGTGQASIISTDGTNVGVPTATGKRAFALGYGCNSTSDYTMTFGAANRATASRAFACGMNCRAQGMNSMASGENNYSNNISEASFGKFNISVTGSTASGQTLFSVGNGTSTSARHNAFEIRQNGDIYITSGGTDIKLQDNLGGGGGGSVTVDSGLDDQSTNPVENQVITQEINDLSAAIDVKADQSELYELLGGSNDEMNPVTPIRLLRISQSDYDTLVENYETDSDTLYIITPDEENEGGE